MELREHGNHGWVVRNRWESLCAQYDYCAREGVGASVRWTASPEGADRKCHEAHGGFRREQVTLAICLRPGGLLHWTLVPSDWLQLGRRAYEAVPSLVLVKDELFSKWVS